MEIYANITPIVVPSLPEQLASYHMVEYFIGKKGNFSQIVWSC